MIFDVTLVAIQSIDVVAGTIQLQIELTMNWRDPRIVFKDLKADTNLNLMSFAEQSDVWVPSVIFVNTESKFVTVNDEKSFVVISREGNSTRNLDNVLNNLFYYSGSENTLSITRNYYQPFLCLFDIG